MMFREIRKKIRMLTSPDRGETVVLRKRKLKIEIAWGDIVAFVAHKKRIVWAIVVLGAVACIVTIFVGRADIARLYPTSCLGGWNETGNAEGMPDVAVGDPPEMFTERNSAFLHNAVGLMYCGGFSGDLPPDANIVATSLKLSLVIKPYTPDVETIPTSTLIQIIIPEDLPVPSSTASTTSGDDTLIDGSSTTDEGQHSDSESSDLEPAAPPEATSSGSSMYAPRAKSFLHALGTQRVRAQESGGDETDVVPVEDRAGASTTATEPSATSSSPDIGTSTENGSSSDQEQNGAFPNQQQFSSATETVVQETALPVLEVSYTIDGSSWVYLGYITERESTSGVSFDISPLSLDEITNLQVSVATMQTLDASFSIFLDGMWIEAQYSHEASPLLSGVEVQNLPREEVDPTEIFKNFKKDFQSHESVEFEIDIFGAGATPTTELNVSSTTSSSSLPEADTSTPVFIESPPPLPSSTSSPTSSPTSWLWRRFFDFARLFSLAGTQTLARQNGIINVEFRGPDGEKASLDYEIIRGGQTATVRVKRNSRSFRPGKYQIIVSVLRTGKVVTASEDFTWGVLAINVNKSIYLPNETAYLQMAVLRDDGHTVCDANLKLEIVSPGGARFAVPVERSGKCGPNNVTDVPDYFVHYQVGDLGIYRIILAQMDVSGNVELHRIEDSFEVRETMPFDVERIGPTRIYPLTDYGMTLRIRANQDFQGQVVESVPILFEILDPGSEIMNEFQIRNSDNPDTKQIIWQVDWKAGENYELKYQFDAPDVSPYLYLLGPLKFSDSLNWLQKLLSDPEGGIIFQEMRQWQIAADAPDTENLQPNGVGTNTNFTVPGKVFFDDYETGNHNNWTGTTTSGTGSLAEVVSTNPYVGTYAGHYYRATTTDAANQAFAYKDFTAPAGNVVWAKGYFRFDSIPSSNYSTVNNVLSLSTTNLDQTKARFNAYSSNTLRCNYLKKDGTWYTSNWGTSLSTGVYYALKISFDNSGANPVITWYVNGSQICTYTDTSTGTAYTPTRVKAGSALDTGITYPDNWYTGTADTRADNVGVYSSDPDLLGCIYNWECELTNDGDTSYVLSTATQIDLYSTQDHGAGSGTINSVTVYIVAKRNDASLRSAATELRTNGTNYAGSSNILGDTYTTYSTAYTTNPSTTLAWTWAEVDAMEIGCNAGTTAVKCTQVYAVVDYTITNGPPSTPTLAETPTFANMQTNDTTPVLGNFSTTDPDSDNVEYEIQWDEDYNFGSPVTKTSSNYPTDAGWAAATFTSGSSTAYTIQAGDALTNGQTYWWRVRARDPLGSNTWSSYSAKRSITINTSLTADRWFQTTGDQFGADVLTDTVTTTDGVKLEGW